MDHKAQDYSQWSNDALIQRVTDLEARLRAQNTSHSPTASSTHSAVPSKKKPKKAPKAFDSSRYSTRFIALKFAYLGTNYNGFEHHSNNTTPLPTIEEELWRALRKTKLIFPTFKEGQKETDVCWDGCEYSKCGRTDKGVSAFGQVIGLRVRSSRPRAKVTDSTANEGDEAAQTGTGNPLPGAQPESDLAERVTADPTWDAVRDELPYIQLLNRVLPPDIRVLAWCPDPPPGFSARFNCKERRYRYFFTNPGYVPYPSLRRDIAGDGWLDIDAMCRAATRFEGLHDFRNFCKIDASKQIENFDRRIFSAKIRAVQTDQEPGAIFARPPFSRADEVDHAGVSSLKPSLYFFEVRGSAFLWHQVRHLVAILFLVGQGYEDPSIVDRLLNTQQTPSKPMYEMASDTPLVLWDCIFPDPAQVSSADHHEATDLHPGYDDALNWIHVGDSIGGRDRSKRYTQGVEDGKYGHNGIMDGLWSLWRRRKMEEVLAGGLLDVVARQGSVARAGSADDSEDGSVSSASARVFDGSESPRPVGKYIPLMQRERVEAAEVINARWAFRKGINGMGSKTQDRRIV